MENIFLLGATGSIGMQTLDVIRTNSDKFVLRSISIGHNIERAKKIIEEFKPEYVSVIEESDAVTLRSEFPEITIESGVESLIKCATCNPNLSGKVIVAVVGYAGIIPTLEAIKINRDILLANKETLVCAGSIVKRLVKEHNVNLIPIDSEHSAIFQALQAGKKEEVQRIIITASGGSFRDLSREELENVTLEDALRHPSWSMGDKITIDSATMVNKGLEVIEAHYLFDLDYDPRFYAGHDLLSSTYPNRVVFADGSWKDDVAYYNASNGNITYYSENNKCDSTFIKEVNQDIMDRISMSNLAIKTNYFKYLK
jgi:1-deoxy-D-xylulose-5-phosphate reductoisomerase